MKKKLQKGPDVVEFMAKIQEQLAVLDRKLDSFMTKSLTELAQARAVQKPLVPVQHSPQPSSRPSLSEQRPHLSRPLYAVICFECGKDTEIPFKPSGDRPVYCKECFAKRRSGNVSKVSAAPSIVAVPAAVVETKPAAAKKKLTKPKKSVVKKKIVAKTKAKKK